MAFDADDDAQRDERQRQKLRARQFREDVQRVFATPEGRRVLWAFLTDAGYDLSPFRPDAPVMAHAVAWQDAGRWWVDALREHCPEREGQMRKEAREAARSASQENSDDD